MKQKVSLTEKQIQIISNLHRQKAELEQAFKLVTERENDVVVSILEAKEIEFTKDSKISYDNGAIVVDNSAVDAEVVEVTES